MDKEFKIINEHVTFYSSLYKKKPQNNWNSICSLNIEEQYNLS